MFSFNGDFARKKTVSLRGKSKSEDKETLLQKRREEREKRQAEKENLRCALLIQRAWRCFAKELKEKDAARKEFDVCLDELLLLEKGGLFQAAGVGDSDREDKEGDIVRRCGMVCLSLCDFFEYKRDKYRLLKLLEGSLLFSVLKKANKKGRFGEGEATGYNARKNSNMKLRQGMFKLTHMLMKLFSSSSSGVGYVDSSLSGALVGGRTNGSSGDHIRRVTSVPSTMGINRRLRIPANEEEPKLRGVLFNTAVELIQRVVSVCSDVGDGGGDQEEESEGCVLQKKDMRSFLARYYSIVGGYLLTHQELVVVSDGKLPVLENGKVFGESVPVQLCEVIFPQAFGNLWGTGLMNGQGNGSQCFPMLEFCLHVLSIPNLTALFEGDGYAVQRFISSVPVEGLVEFLLGEFAKCSDGINALEYIEALGFKSVLEDCKKSFLNGGSLIAQLENVGHIPYTGEPLFENFIGNFLEISNVQLKSKSEAIAFRRDYFELVAILMGSFESFFLQDILAKPCITDRRQKDLHSPISDGNVYNEHANGIDSDSTGDSDEGKDTDEEEDVGVRGSGSSTTYMDVDQYGRGHFSSRRDEEALHPIGAGHNLREGFLSDRETMHSTLQKRWGDKGDTSKTILKSMCKLSTKFCTALAHVHKQLRNVLCPQVGTQSVFGKCLMETFAELSFCENLCKAKKPEFLVENEGSVLYSHLGRIPDLIELLLCSLPRGSNWHVEILNLVAFKEDSNSGGLMLLDQLWDILDKSWSRFDGLWEKYCRIHVDVRTRGSFSCLSSVLFVFASSLQHYLMALEDSEFIKQLEVTPKQQGGGKVRIFGRESVLNMCKCMLGLATSLYYNGYNLPDIQRSFQVNDLINRFLSLRSVLTVAVVSLYNKDWKLSFCPDDFWISSNDMFHAQGFPLFTDDVINKFFGRDTSTGERQWSSKNASQLKMRRFEPTCQTESCIFILKHLPFVISLDLRISLFFGRVIGRNNNTDASFFGPKKEIRVRRDFIYEDAYDSISGIDEGLNQKWRISFINEFGVDESGIDGGGLFKEFVTSLVKVGFDSNYGFFVSTSDNKFYPNPEALTADVHALSHFNFLGKILGKAVLEGILVELPLAQFFLQKLIGCSNSFDDLNSLDPELYRNLMFLKTYEGNDVEDVFSLTFSTVASRFGENTVIDLIENGRNVPVNASNKLQYIYLLAHHKLNVAIKPQCEAFLSGFSRFVDRSVLKLFNAVELQYVISGSDAQLDISDLRNNTKYSNGFSDEHPVIKVFWEAVSTFSKEQLGQLLKFVTSCSRPPLLGCQELSPPFCIHSAGCDDRLPTASTCVNLLKLPEILDVKQMREKLLYSIESGAGFDLS